MKRLIVAALLIVLAASSGGQAPRLSVPPKGTGEGACPPLDIAERAAFGDATAIEYIRTHGGFQ